MDIKYTIKAVGDWELDVLAIPYGKDKDGQTFDANTEYMLDQYPAPPLIYHHGIKPGNKEIEDTPVVVGTAKSVEKRQDGVWIRYSLNKVVDYAKTVWEAAKKGLAGVSSDSIGHLARLEIGGKRVMYEKKPGRIAVWPLAAVSIWDLGDGQLIPASNQALAMPALKTIYKQAGIDLPDIDEEQELETDGESVAESAKSKQDDGENIMSVKEEALTEEQVQAKIDAALKAQADKVQAEKEAELKRQEEIDAEVEKRTEALKAEWAEKNRLPSDKGTPYVAKYAEAWKYDNLSPEDHAVMVGVLQAAKQGGRSKYGASDGAVKALAIKMLNSEGVPAADARNALKSAGFTGKADEVMQQDLSSYGDEWVGVAYSTALWESIRVGTFVAGKLPSMEVPAGHESVTIPLESGDPTFYKVAETTAHDATMGFPVASVTSSQMGTANVSLTLSKMGARVSWSGELEEDSLIPFVSQLRNQLAVAGAEYLESAIIDGDTATAASTNINDIAATGAVAGTEHFLLFNGFRKSPLVTTTANSRDAAAGLTVDDYLETVKLMGGAGINALDRNKVEYIIDPNTHFASLKLAELATDDVRRAGGTIQNGMLGSLWGYNINVSGAMHKLSAVRKANSAGKIDQDTTSNNAYGAILGVRWDQWLMGYRRRMTMEVTRYPRSDSSEIVALMRVGLIQRDTEAAAISYNVGV